MKMTPLEKAIELVDKYSELGIGHPTSLLLPKKCALIAVNEIIENEKIDNLEDNNLSYWQKVKQEIEIL